MAVSYATNPLSNSLLVRFYAMTLVWNEIHEEPDGSLTKIEVRKDNLTGEKQRLTYRLDSMGAEA